MALSQRIPLKARLEGRLTKLTVEEIASDILSGRIAVQEVRTLFSAPDSVNVYWAIAAAVNRSAEACKGIEKDLLQSMIRHSHNDGVVRNVLSVFKKADIPDCVEDKLYHFCFGLIESAGTPVAHRSFSMIICARLCKKYPELSFELLPAVKRSLETHGAVSPGVRSAAKQVFKMLTPHLNKSYP